MKKQKKISEMSIHFVGIKGTNMTPLAIIAKQAGALVTGSDIDQEFITDAALKKENIFPFVGFSPDHVASPDLVITTGAHGGFDNIEVQTAKEKDIPVVTAGEATGIFMQGTLFRKKYVGISVAGAHGKTTTSAMLATILNVAKYDPSYIVGTGDVSSLDGPGHFGKGKFFVAEADEYATEPTYDKRARFLWQHPEIMVFTNIEFDHPDIYESIDQTRETFLTFARQLPQNGMLVACGDDREIQKLLKDFSGRVITYGFSPTNEFVIKRVTVSGDQTFFWVERLGMEFGECVIRVPGEHNALNALAAMIVCLEKGIPFDLVKKGLLAFQGSKRRLEFMGTLKTGAKAYDDYAHHPTEITKTLNTLRKQYPRKKLVCIFQPHTYSRTKRLFTDFVNAFDDVDSLLVTDIYASLREAPDETISSRSLVDAMRMRVGDVRYLATLSDVVKYINEKRFRADTILVTMGAGDIYTIHDTLEFSK